MKVVLTSRAPFVAGAEVAVERLALGLGAAGHDVTLVVGTCGEALRRLESKGIRCVFIPQRYTSKWGWVGFQSSRLRLRRLLQRLRPDVVHSNDLPTHQLTAAAASGMAIPRICHHRWIYDKAAIDWLNKYGAERHLFVSDALQQALCGAASCLTDVPCQVVYDGLELPAVPKASERDQAKQALGLNVGKVCVLLAGQVIQRKGIADALHAWGMLSTDDRARAQLVIVGDDLEQAGSYRHQMERLAATLDIDVLFVGFQRNVPTWLTASEIVLVPSHAEPLGNATLEAMAHGRPVIGTRIGGIPEMVEHTRTGLLVPARSPAELANAIRELIQDATRRELLGAEARRQCEQRFSLDTHVAGVIQQYDVAIHRFLGGSSPAC